MKQFFSFLILVGLTAAILPAQGQIGFGARLGANMANVGMKILGEDFETDGIIGYHVGGFLDLELADGVYFQPGLLVSQKGYGMELDLGIFGKTESKVKPVFIEIPLNAVYRYQPRRADWAVFGVAGPYLGYGIMGKVSDEDNDEDIKFGDGADDTMKPLDFGLNIGAGFEYNGAFLQLNYGLGFANLTPGGDGDNGTKNKVIGISVGYRLAD